jgi:cytochrome c nitrite reductase small subunit
MGLVRRFVPAIAALVVGAAAGVGAFTFSYAKGSSYLTDDPRACANCHVMEEQYAGWSRSSHRSVAVCNDCHTPPGMVAKYATKARNGWHHSFAFTTGRFPDPIRITPRNRAVTQASCAKCHGPLIAAIDSASTGKAHGSAAAGLDCLTCHRDVGHLH